MPRSAVTEQRFVTPEALNVAPDLVGRPLASPWRRLLAMALDLAVIGLLSNLGNLGLAAGLVLVAWQLRSGAADPRWRRMVGWALVMLFALLAARDAWIAVQDHARPAAEQRAETGDDESSPAAIKAIGAGLPDAKRIALLEAALMAAGKSQPGSVREELERLVDLMGASFGWGVVYFSLLPVFWPGQTLGKKLLGLRVVELTGKPMTVMRSLKRYGGYAAGMATGGLGFTQLLWDPNRQAIQDRAAHTVVIDLRAPGPRPSGSE